MMVVVVHERYYLRGTTWEPFAESAMRAGGMGVDLFFLISGFIMAHTTGGVGGGGVAAARFVVRRFARIWPVYAILMLIAIPQIHGLAYFSDQWRSIAMAMLFLPLDASQLPYLGTPYPLGWTLNYEMYFYLLLGACLLLDRWRWLALAAWFAAVTIAIPVWAGSFSLDTRQGHGWSAFAEQVSNPIALDFLTGVLIGLFHRNFRPLISGRLRGGLSLVALGTTGFAIFWNLHDNTLFHGLAGWGWPLALMLFALSAADRAMTIPTPLPVVWLGQISYSLYLSHPITLRACNRAMSYFGIEAYTHTWVYIAMTMALAIFFAWISWRMLECWLSNRLRDRALSLLDRFVSAPAQRRSTC